MKVQCDGCESAEAVVVCCADEAALCRECDIKVHDANKLAGKHHRVPLFRPPSKTSCDICQDKTGYFFCLEDRALLCHNCDMSIHKLSAASANHRRFLVTGVTASLHTVSGQAAAGATATTSPGTPPAKSSPRASNSNSNNSHPTKITPAVSSKSTRRRDHGENVAEARCQSQASPSPRASSSTSNASAMSKSSTENYSISQAPEGRKTVSQVPESRKTTAVATTAAAAAALRAPPAPAQQASPAVPGDVSRKTSIFEFLTEAVPGWKCDDLLNLSETSSMSSGYSLDPASKITDTSFSWLSNNNNNNSSSVFGNDQIYSRSVPQMDKLPSNMHSSRSVADQTTKFRTKQQDSFFFPEADDTFVVPDLSLHSAPELPPAVKRRRTTTYSELDNIFLS